MQQKNNSVPASDNEIQDLVSGKSSAATRDSSSASMNKEKLAQEQEGFRVFSEGSEKLPNEGVADGEILAANGSSTDSIAGVDDDPEGDNNLEIVMGTDADVTEEDLLILGDKDRDMDQGEDEEFETAAALDDKDEDGDPLNEAVPSAFGTGDDLDSGDIDPSDPAGDSMGQGDEENSYYSLSDNEDSDDDTAGDR